MLNNLSILFWETWNIYQPYYENCTEDLNLTLVPKFIIMSHSISYIQMPLKFILFIYFFPLSKEISWYRITKVWSCEPSMWCIQSMVLFGFSNGDFRFARSIPSIEPNWYKQFSCHTNRNFVWTDKGVRLIRNNQRARFAQKFFYSAGEPKIYFL